MPNQIVLLSGRVCAGKSSLARLLAKNFSFTHIKTQKYLQDYNPSVDESRHSLQELGQRLDKKTGGAWVVTGLIKDMGSSRSEEGAHFVIDAVRIREQIEKIRRAFGSRVVHVHLEAPPADLAERYGKRSRRKRNPIKEFPSYEYVGRNRTEKQVDTLRALADVVVDTKRCTRYDVLTRVACHLGLYGRDCKRLVDVLVGGQFGSEGKGQVAAYLANEYDVLVRVGGPNAGHSVYEEPEPDVFHLLPSGTRRKPDSRIIIGPGAVLDVKTLQEEIGQCQLDVGRLRIDPQAMIICKSDKKVESGLKSRIGSTGQGVGSATSRKVLDRGKRSVVLARDVSDLRPYIGETWKELQDCFREGRRILLEGTQGTGLSLHHGDYPYVTSRDTTVAGCLSEAGISPSRVRKIVMVCRTYPIRVESPRGSSSGPMSKVISWLEVSRRAGIPVSDLRKSERTSTTKRRRRVGEFDWQRFRKAISLNAPTDIAITFIDYLKFENRKARRFEQLHEDSIRFIEEVERFAEAPVSLISTCFDFRPIIDRRRW